MSDCDLDRILSLAKAVSAAESGPLWKSDIEAALDKHSDCTEALWSELDRQIKGRESSGIAVPVAEHIEKVEKRIRREVAREIKRDLHDIVGRYLSDVI